MQKVYIIIEEFDDHYHGINSVGEHAYFSKISAEEECDRLNKKSENQGVSFSVVTLTIKETNSTNFIKRVE